MLQVGYWGQVNVKQLLFFLLPCRGFKEDDCGPHSLVRGFRGCECWVADKAFRGDGEFQLWVWGSKANAQPVTWPWWRSRPRLLVSGLSKPPVLQETTQVAAISRLPVHTVTPCQQNSFLLRKRFRYHISGSRGPVGNGTTCRCALMVCSFLWVLPKGTISPNLCLGWMLANKKMLFFLNQFLINAPLTDCRYLVC